jgi:hypothetical protein
VRAVRGTAAGVAGAVSLPPPLSQHHITASYHSTMSGGTVPARAGLLSSHTGCSTLPSAGCQLKDLLREMEFWSHLNFDCHVKIIFKLQKQNR